MKKSPTQSPQSEYAARVREHHKSLKDTWRIDWLEEHGPPALWAMYAHAKETLREAIDRQMGYGSTCGFCGGAIAPDASVTFPWPDFPTAPVCLECYQDNWCIECANPVALCACP